MKLKSPTGMVVALSILALLLSLLVFAYVAQKQDGTIFSERAMLDGIWQNYKKEYLEAETFRALDKQQNNITTSEGQSYSMLRAVWMDDKETFDKSWQWTKDNLDRPDDRLFSWLFGERPDGSYGILTDRGGENSASDADSDIALALIFAAAKWQQQSYLADAKAIVSDIWEHEIIEIQGKPYLAANNLEKFAESEILINPSYLSPYAYRIFSNINPENNWEGVIDSSYEILEKSSVANLDKDFSAGLVPDWVAIDRFTGELNRPQNPSLTTNYSFDAFRTPWRLALDFVWYKEERAKKILELFKFLEQELQEKSLLYSSYSHDGIVLLQTESPAAYGGNLGYFFIITPIQASNYAKNKLESLYNPDTYNWKEKLGYYDSNWAWFGLGLYYGQLNNLTENLP
ncbi:MAG: hypothetical protein JNN11_01435 [Candidatus Doudnabacteria bacterium]|nr:hypothetical protein [Candidatus Doudnabacteria bacterium]